MPEMSQYEAFKILRESGILLEKKLRFKDGRKYNVHKAIFELAGKENYKHVPLTRKNIRFLNATLKPTKA